MSAPLFFTSDTHFGHTNIIKYSNRPFIDSTHMDNELVDNWNNIVPENATVWHLGDVFLSRGKVDSEPLLKRLNGRIHFVMGNHDNQKELTRLAKHQDYIPSYVEIKHEKQRIILCHYSLRSWNKMHYGSWHLFGHSHGGLNHVPLGKSMDVGIDSIASMGLGYRPISFEEVKSHMDSQEIKSLDHHSNENPRFSFKTNKETK